MTNWSGHAVTNWIPDTNRFSLTTPPEWWLKKLWDFDSSLVVIPSRQQALYRLAQKRPLSLTEKAVHEMLKEQADAQMMASYGLIPVTSIMMNPNWANPAMFIELHNRAPHRLGGAEKALAVLEAQEAKDELDKQFKLNDHLDSLGKDAWGMYKKKIGVQSNMYIPKSDPDPT